MSIIRSRQDKMFKYNSDFSKGFAFFQPESDNPDWWPYSEIERLSY